MLTPEQDRRRKRRLAEQYNPELGLGEPGEKRKSKGGLAERTTIASTEEVKDGVRRMQNDSKKSSKEGGSDDNLAFAGGWGQILGEVFASENESPELKETRDRLSDGVPDYYKGVDIDVAFDSKEEQDKRVKELDQNRAAGGNLPSFIFQGSKFREALSDVEAESYRTLFGNAEEKNTPFKDVDITTMSMKEVFNLIEKNGKFHRFNLAKGKDTTAIGKYQMVGATLRDLKDRNILKEIGIDDDTLFDENTQDKIAIHLAERRVKPSYSITKARKEMRNEWEGFKKLSDKKLDAIINEVRGG